MSANTDLQNQIVQSVVNNNNASRCAVIIVGRSYPNILSLLYETEGVSDCDVFVIRTRCERLSLRGRYLHMRPETASRRVKRHFLILGSDDWALWPRINAAIEEIVTSKCYEKIVFFPVDDVSCLLLNEHKEEFSHRYVFHGIGENGRGDCEWLSEKFRQKRLAEEFGIPFAMGCVMTRDSNAGYGFGYPCIVKVPQSIKTYTETKGVVGKCTTKEDLHDCLQKAWSYGLDNVLVEEYLPIEYEMGMSGVCTNGRILGLGVFKKSAVCTGIRLGNTVSGKVIDYKANPLLVDFVERIGRMLRHIAYNGLFDVDMAYGRGKYYLIEINLRIGAFTFSVVAAGVPLVKLYIDSLRGHARNEIVTPTVFGLLALNERALLEEMGVGEISISKYFGELRKGKVRKIKNLRDKGPYKIFRRLSLLALISCLLGPLEPIAKNIYHHYRRMK